MKKIYTILIPLSPLVSFSQNLSYSMNEIQLNFDEILDYFQIYIRNHSNDTIELAFTLERICYLPDDDTQIGLSVNGFHFFPVDETTTWWDDLSVSGFELAPQDSTGAFKIELYPGMHGSTWDLIVFDKHNPDQEDRLHVIIEQEECITNTKLLNDDYFIGIAYPNPVKNTFMIPVTTPSNTELVIVDILGQVLKVIPLNEGIKNIEMSTDEFSSGLFFYYLRKDWKVSKVQSIIMH